MIPTLVQIALANALLATPFAILLAILGRYWRDPQLLHALWVLVLIKLLTPPLVRVPMPFLSEAFGEPIKAGPLLSTLGWIWVSGSVIWLGLALYRLLSFHRLIKNCQPAALPIQQRTRQLGQFLELSRIPLVVLCPARLSPLLWTLGKRPLLIIPEGLLTRLEADSVDTLLAHELAHFKRRDHWVRWVELTACAIFWWNPLVWWARYEIEKAEESSCDEKVMGAFPRQGKAYVKALLETLVFLSQKRPQLPPTASAMGHGFRFLLSRVNWIQHGKKVRYPGLAPWVALASILFLLPWFPGPLPFVGQLVEAPQKVEPTIEAPAFTPLPEVLAPAIAEQTLSPQNQVPVPAQPVTLAKLYERTLEAATEIEPEKAAKAFLAMSAFTDEERSCWQESALSAIDEIVKPSNKAFFQTFSWALAKTSLDPMLGHTLAENLFKRGIDSKVFDQQLAFHFEPGYAAEAFSRLGRNAFAKDRYLESRNWFDQLAEVSVGSQKSEALYLAGLSAHKMSDRSETEKRWQRLRFESPSSWGEKGLLALAKQQQDEDDAKGISILHHYVANYYHAENWSEACYRLGKGLMKAGKHKAASRWLIKAKSGIKGQSFGIQSSQLLVEAYYHQFKLDSSYNETLWLLRNAHEAGLADKIDFNREVAEWLSSRLYQDQKHQKMVALAELGFYRHLPPQDYPFHWKDLGQALLAEKHYAESNKAFDLFLAHHQNEDGQAKAWLDKGNALLGLGNFGQARACAKRVLEIERKGKLSAFAWLLLGDISRAQSEV